MFTEKDAKQIENKGLKDSDVLQQIEKFKEGFPFMKLTRPCVPGDGILKLNEEEKERLRKIYKASELKVEKFTPASGAASRMFKSLFEFLDQNLGSSNQQQALLEDEKVKRFFEKLKSFAFFDALTESIKYAGESLDDLLEKNKYAEVLKFLLTETGLNYGALPKGLLLFHKDQDGISRIPLEEHLVEAVEYAGKGGVCKLHFTVSPEHEDAFEEAIAKLVPAYEKKHGVKFEISFSQQKSYTDTIAVDPENNLFRNDDGSLLFRPAGHGALLENLNELESDLIFIKNIDNVVPDHLKPETIAYKEALAGLAIELKNELDQVSESLISGSMDAETAMGFLKSKLNSEIPSDATKAMILTKLERPLRVCGMVINTGEAGGGPFWCENKDGSVSLQIVESSQFNVNDAKQMNIVKDSTHFNPVDLIVLKSDRRKGSFDLKKFVDPDTGFISSKSKDGKSLKAMELPGLWNGSMSDWNTVFVEVPAITFNPVKEVNDLLRPEHQVESD